MPARLRVARRHCGERDVVVLEGAVDGSTACHALAVLARTGTEPCAPEIVLDLSAITVVEPFGLEVFSRGLRQLARGRCIRLRGPALLLPLLTALAESLRAEHAT